MEYSLPKEESMPVVSALEKLFYYLPFLVQRGRNRSVVIPSTLCRDRFGQVVDMTELVEPFLGWRDHLAIYSKIGYSFLG
jgi:hypothetical protein